MNHGDYTQCINVCTLIKYPNHQYKSRPDKIHVGIQTYWMGIYLFIV